MSAADEEHAGSRSTALCDLKRPAGAVLDGLFGKDDELANIRIGPLDDLDDGLNTCGGKITGHATPSSPRAILRPSLFPSVHGPFWTLPPR